MAAACPRLRAKLAICMQPLSEPAQVEKAVKFSEWLSTTMKGWPLALRDPSRSRSL